MQSRLRSTFWSNRSISFLGRVYTYRKGEAGMSLLTTVWITAPTIAECTVTTYCCPLNEGPHRERPFWKNRKASTNYCGKFALNWMLQGNQACSASRSNKFTDVNKPGLGGASWGQRVHRAGATRASILRRQLAGRRLPSLTSTGSIPSVLWPAPCKEHWTEGKDQHVDCLPSKLYLFIVMTNTHFFPVDQYKLLCWVS